MLRKAKPVGALNFVRGKEMLQPASPRLAVEIGAPDMDCVATDEKSRISGGVQ